MSRSFQEWVHWLELGTGAAWIRRTALWLGIVLLSLLVCYKQFRGPRTEVTLRQAVVARQLAHGQGYTTLVNYPQTAAHLEKHGVRWDQGAFPELHQAPLYPAVLGAVFGVMPEWVREPLFEAAPEEPNGFPADYVLLAVNVALLWLAAILLHRLGCRLFDPAVALVSTLGLVLSAPLWQSTVAVNGTPLGMVLALVLMHLALRVEEGRTRGTLPGLWLGLAGAACGGFFLLDYSAGLVVLPVLVYAWLRFAGQRGAAIVPVALGFLLVSGSWCAWYAARTGAPLGFAWQEVALRVDGSAADPALVRNTLDTAVPPLSLAKLGNKGLSALQATLQERLWSAGGLLFAGFFVAGLLHRHRQPRLNALRALFLGILAAQVAAHGLLTSGEGERDPIAWLAPLLILFGAGFAAVLVASADRLAEHGRWVLGGLVALQALPLAQDVLEPRSFHFSYPPYYPTLFLGMKPEMLRRGGENPGWMADVPAGAAWYSGQRVWSQPATLKEFYAIGSEQPMLALVLTAKTLDRPFFTELGRRTDAQRVGDWADIYAGLPSGRMPATFPLSLPQKVSDNLHVLIDPLAQPVRRP